MTYTKTTTGTGPYTYTLNPTTIKNNGVTSITAWQFTFDLPPGMTTLTCPTSVVCSQTATTVTVKTAPPTAQLQLVRRGHLAFHLRVLPINTPSKCHYIGDIYHDVPSNHRPDGCRDGWSKSGGVFPLTVTISNNSGQPIKRLAGHNTNDKDLHADTASWGHLYVYDLVIDVYRRCDRCCCGRAIPV